MKTKDKVEVTVGMMLYMLDYGHYDEWDPLKMPRIESVKVTGFDREKPKVYVWGHALGFERIQERFAPANYYSTVKAALLDGIEDQTTNIDQAQYVIGEMKEMLAAIERGDGLAAHPEVIDAGEGHIQEAIDGKILAETLEKLSQS